MAVIAGVVTTGAGDPVAGARVLFSESPVPVPDVAAVTGNDGGFQLAAPVPGSYQLTVATDDAVTQAPVEVAAGAERAEVQVVVPGAPPG